MIPSTKKTAILGSLIAVAWADGNLNKSEVELIQEYIIQMKLNKKETSEVHGFVFNPIPLENLVSVLTDLDDQLFLVSQAYVMSASDKNLAFDEVAIINKIVSLFNLDSDSLARVKRISTDMMQLVLEYRNEHTESPKDILDATSKVIHRLDKLMGEQHG